MCNLRKEKPTVTLKLHLFRSEIVLLHLAELQMMEGFSHSSHCLITSVQLESNGEEPLQAALKISRKT